MQYNDFLYKYYSFIKFAFMIDEDIGCIPVVCYDINQNEYYVTDAAESFGFILIYADSNAKINEALTMGDLFESLPKLPSRSLDLNIDRLPFDVESKYKDVAVSFYPNDKLCWAKVYFMSIGLDKSGEICLKLYCDNFIT